MNKYQSVSRALPQPLNAISLLYASLPSQSVITDLLSWELLPASFTASSQQVMFVFGENPHWYEVKTS